MPKDRSESAYRVRVEAAELARHRTPPKHEANPDEARYGAACYPMNFTKGLEHDWETGLVAEPAHFQAFRAAIDAGFAESFTTRVPVPRVEGERRRPWEAPTAGVVFELEGPDPQAVTMPPAPELGSDELTFEMAEVYELALLRDVPFTEFADGGTAGGLVEQAADRLNKLPYAMNEFLQGRDRKTSEVVVPGTNPPGTATTVVQLDPQTLFRGSSPGVEHGPYLSQFLLIGTEGDPEEGKIAYGAQIIDQRVIQVETNDDYMMVWDDWLRVQRGFDPRKLGDLGQKKIGSPRFICTPRDLATYVHVDQLYQAYLNACLILLGQGAQFDPSFGLLSGQGKGVLDTPSSQEFTDYNAGGFALWGGPHILSLVTEVATRGLKAVRFQKFNNHLRLRPEALAARIEKAKEIEDRNPSLCKAFTKMGEDLSKGPTEATDKTVDAVRARNPTNTALLPMAFAEGSPMHPTYGAGHATVAGACVTMLKAFFDTSAIFVRVSSKSSISAHFYTKDQIIDAIKRGAKVEYGSYSPIKKKDEKITTAEGEKYIADSELSFEVCGYFNLELNHLGDEERAAAEKAKDKASPFYQKDLSKIPNRYLELLTKGKKHCCPLTLEGELNKLAANISIGRNMAGVHYFSDYYDSARMGEEIALGILEEQALCYPTDDFVVSVPTFDGEIVRIGRK